jgi:hypothetical protein
LIGFHAEELGSASQLDQWDRAGSHYYSNQDRSGPLFDSRGLRGYRSLKSAWIQALSTGTSWSWAILRKTRRGKRSFGLWDFRNDAGLEVSFPWTLGWAGHGHLKKFTQDSSVFCRLWTDFWCIYSPMVAADSLCGLPRPLQITGPLDAAVIVRWARCSLCCSCSWRTQQLLAFEIQKEDLSGARWCMQYPIPMDKIAGWICDSVGVSSYFWH